MYDLRWKEDGSKTLWFNRKEMVKMDKKLTPLEALEKVRHCTYPFARDNQEAFDIIETALKDYETHEEILKHYGLSLVNFREACLLLAMLKGEHLNIHNIANQLKALEIIAKKNVLPSHIKNTQTCEEYNHFAWLIQRDYLEEQEYNLLKEVLEWADLNN